MTPGTRQQLNEAIDKRLNDEHAILYDYYRRKLGSNKDARAALSKHLEWHDCGWARHVLESTKHWNNLDNER